MNPVRVVNVRGGRTPEQRRAVVYVGRAWAGWPAHPLANPFRLAADTPQARAECLHRYRVWLWKRPDLETDMTNLWVATSGGYYPLGCWCHPKPCHADVLAAILNDWPWSLRPS